MNQPNESRGVVAKFVNDVLSTEKSIGDLNGKWAVLFKLVFLGIASALPATLAWGIWVTTNIYASQHHRNDTNDFRQRIVDIEKVLTLTPDQINKLENNYEKVQTELKDINTSNSSDHQKMMIQLSKIQTKLEDIEIK